jgi:imidazolonepropionase
MVTPISADLVVRHIGQLLTMVPDEGTADDGGPSSLGLRSEAALAAREGRLVWVGSDDELDQCVTYDKDNVIDAQGRLVTPGLVDAHTHLVFAGQRHLEFALRLAGASYLEILAAGGGILNTVRHTREATAEALLTAARPRAQRCLEFGVTTCEIKSGYGLDWATERKMLEVIAEVDRETPLRVVPTFLGAHVVPQEHREAPERYVDELCQTMIPHVAAEGLAVMCDVFLDQGAFSRDQAERILTTASQAGLGLRLHAGQFAELGGPELAAELNARSVDHAEKVSAAGREALAQAGVVVCLLPGAALSLGLHYPDAKALRAAGVDVALATDCNPGTSMTENLPLMMTLGATAMALSVEDCWRGVTTVAARALGLDQEVGALAPGYRADLVIFDAPDYRYIPYHFGVNHARQVLIGGQVCIG